MANQRVDLKMLLQGRQEGREWEERGGDGGRRKGKAWGGVAMAAEGIMDMRQEKRI